MSGIRRRTFVTLLGISHAAYVGGKLPNRPGDPVGLSLDNVQENPVNPQPDGTPRNAPTVPQGPPRKLAAVD